MPAPPCAAKAAIAAAGLIPLRLGESEREALRVLDGALQVSEYTEKVDFSAISPKSSSSFRQMRSTRITEQFEELLATVAGLTVVASTKDGGVMVECSLAENADTFATVFEIGRRYKMMNPDKMRSTYGKLMYILQDALVEDKGRRLLKIRSAKGELEALGCLPLLSDPRALVAITPLEPGEGPVRKSRAVAELLATFSRGDAYASERIERCLLSISDDAAHARLSTRRVT